MSSYFNSAIFFRRIPMPVIESIVLLIALQQRFHSHKLNELATEQGRSSAGRHNSPIFRITNALTIAISMLLCITGYLEIFMCDYENPERLHDVWFFITGWTMNLSSSCALSFLLSFLYFTLVSASNLITLSPPSPSLGPVDSSNVSIEIKSNQSNKSVVPDWVQLLLLILAIGTFLMGSVSSFLSHFLGTIRYNSVFLIYLIIVISMSLCVFWYFSYILMSHISSTRSSTSQSATTFCFCFKKDQAFVLRATTAFASTVCLVAIAFQINNCNLYLSGAVTRPVIPDMTSVLRIVLILASFYGLWVVWLPVFSDTCCTTSGASEALNSDKMELTADANGQNKRRQSDWSTHIDVSDLTNKQNQAAFV